MRPLDGFTTAESVQRGRKGGGITPTLASGQPVSAGQPDHRYCGESAGPEGDTQGQANGHRKGARSSPTLWTTAVDSTHG